MINESLMNNFLGSWAALLRFRRRTGSGGNSKAFCKRLKRKKRIIIIISLSRS